MNFEGDRDLFEAAATQRLEAEGEIVSPALGLPFNPCQNFRQRRLREIDVDRHLIQVRPALAKIRLRIEEPEKREGE